MRPPKFQKEISRQLRRLALVVAALSLISPGALIFSSASAIGNAVAGFSDAAYIEDVRKQTG